jgi:hypothetical protein
MYEGARTVNKFKSQNRKAKRKLCSKEEKGIVDFGDKFGWPQNEVLEALYGSIGGTELEPLI